MIRPTTIDRYLARRFTSALIKALLAFIMLFVLIDLLTHRRDNIADLDIPWLVVAGYYLTLIPWVLGQVAPLSLLVAALLVLGDAAQNNEVTAMLASGVSLRRFVRMPVLVALVFSLGLFALDQTIGARATGIARDFEREYFSRDTDVKRSGITWARLSGGWTCHVFKFNRTALTGEKVFLNAIRPNAVEHVRARRIFWDETRRKWLLEDGIWAEFDPETGAKRKEIRISQLPAPLEESPGLLFAMDRPSETMTVGDLSTLIDYADKRGVSPTRLLVDLHSRFSQPAIAFVTIWLAVPFAMRLRRGGLAISFGASIGIALLYYVFYSVSLTLGNAGHLSPALAAWIANVLFLGGGIVLFVRTPT